MNRNQAAIVIAALIIVFVPSSASAADFVARNHGLFGGEILALTGLPDGRLVASTYHGAGIFLSDDLGEGWIPIGRPRDSEIGVLAAAADGTLFAGGTGSGVHISTEGGRSWEQTISGLPTYMSRVIRAFGISPDYPDDRTVFIGTLDGLYMSDDGNTFQPVGDRFAGKDIFGIAVSPGFAEDRTLFVTVGGEGVHRSTDGGKTWENANHGLPDLWAGGIAISPRFNEDRTLFVGTGGALCRSTDGGETWEVVRGGGVSKIFFSPGYEADRTVYFIASRTVHRSVDGGDTWSPFSAGLPELEIWDLAFAGDSLFAATYGAGIYRYDPGSEQWIWKSHGIIPRIVSLAISPAFATDRTVYAGTWGAGVFVSTDGGMSWNGPALAGKWIEGLALSPDYPTDGTVFAATSDYVYRSADRGETWERLQAGMTNRIVSAIAVSPRFTSDRTVFIGTRGGFGNGVLVSTDGDETWREINSGFLATIEHVSVRSLAVSPDYGNDRTVFAGLYYNEGLARSTDGGSDWTRVFEAGNFVAVAVSPEYASDGTVLAASRGKGIYRSTDRGETWENVLYKDEGVFISDISFSPDYARDRTVYAAGEGGLWRSTDGGESWKEVPSAPGALSVDAIAIDPDDPGHLFIGTYANGVFEVTIR